MVQVTEYLFQNTEPSFLFVVPIMTNRSRDRGRIFLGGHQEIPANSSSKLAKVSVYQKK